MNHVCDPHFVCCLLTIPRAMWATLSDVNLPLSQPVMADMPFTVLWCQLLLIGYFDGLLIRNTHHSGVDVRFICISLKLFL
jgi:hypothetical protein